MNSFLKIVSAVIRPTSLRPAPDMKRKRQYAALPFRVTKGKLEVLLVTSRETRRWIIPKGWPKKNTAPHKLALLEAYEEAGIRGKIQRDEIGHYDYIKRVQGRHGVFCRVGVFPMNVKDELKTWPEKNERERQWMSPQEAAERVEEPQLAALLLSLGTGKSA